MNVCEWEGTMPVIGRRSFIRLLSGAALATAFAPAGGAQTKETPANAPQTLPKTLSLSLRFFSDAQLDSVRSNPARIRDLYSSEFPRYSTALGPAFADAFEEHLELSFCSLFSYESAPYGNSTAIELDALLAEKALDCDNYCALAWRLFLVMRPSPTTVVAAVGWDGGVIGNHAQLFFRHANGRRGMVDPTIGLWQRNVDFDSIASGKPVPVEFLKSFYSRSGSIDSFNTRVQSALVNGLYRPSDLLYFVTDIEKFLHPPEISKWMTPRSRFLT
jgi:hypothetical protein